MGRLKTLWHYSCTFWTPYWVLCPSYNTQPILFFRNLWKKRRSRWKLLGSLTGIKNSRTIENLTDLENKFFFNSAGTSRKISQPFRHFKQNLKGQRFLWFFDIQRLLYNRQIIKNNFCNSRGMVWIFMTRFAHLWSGTHYRHSTFMPPKAYFKRSFVGDSVTQPLQIPSYPRHDPHSNRSW